MSNRMSFVLAVVVLLCGAALRLTNLTTLPVGLSDAEMAEVDLMEDQIKRGDIRVFYERSDGNGEEGLYPMLLAVSSLAFGDGTLGFRILSVFAGVLTLALSYALGVRLFGRMVGLATILIGALMLWQVLLSRLVLVESFLPLLITATLLALARAMPVYPRTRAERTNTLDFAGLGVLLGMGLYLHPTSLMLTLAAMAFITYIILTRRPLSLRRLSYIGFAILMLVIIALPYLLSTFRLPELSASGRIFGGYSGLINASANSLLALFIRGDMSALYNWPGRPLIDTVSGVFVVIGVVACVRQWRNPRYALLLLAAICLAPAALLVQEPPSFLAFSALLPIIALFAALGVTLLLRNLPDNTRLIGLIGVLALLGFNIFWTINDLFVRWPHLERVQEVYNADLGRIAHHLDTTAGHTPTVMCYPGWDSTRTPAENRSASEWVLLMMNHDSAPLRFADCQNAFVLTNGGAYQQVIFAAPQLRQLVSPEINRWLELGDDLDNLPDDTVIGMDVQAELAQALGVFTTTTPAAFDVAAGLDNRQPVPPPIRFGGNITWLGYVPRELRSYQPGERVPVTTYWRIEGRVPSDLTIFHHILSNPVTLLRARDILSVNPQQLRNRDILIQRADIPLPQTTLPGAYAVSVGVYQSSSDERLPVVAGGQERGERLFLYRIDVPAPPERTNESDN